MRQPGTSNQPDPTPPAAVDLAAPTAGGPPGARRWATKDLTTGSIPKNLWGLAWPQAVEGVMRIVDQMADLVWAGMLGTKSIAGIGVAQQYTQMAWTSRMGIDTSMRAMVSRAIGMGDLKLANHVVFQAFTCTFFFFLAIATLGVIFTEPLLRLLGVSEGVIGEAAPYMRIQFIGQGVVAFQQQTGQALAASGNTITPMRATMLARVIHIFLSPVLVFGLWIFPEMGLAGAALGSIIANAFGLVINAKALFLGTSLLHLRFEDYRVDFTIIRQIIRIGIPAAINGMERTMAQLILVVLVTPFGDTALAAFTLTRRIEMFTNLGSQGFGMASGVIVGQSLGAGKPERARSTVLWATGFVVAIKSVVIGFLFFFPELVLGIFTQEQDVLEVATKWVRIGVVAYYAMGVGQVAMQSYQTAGDTVFPALVTLIAFWVIELPLAYYLSKETSLGQYGVAWAMLVAMSSRLFLLVPYFFTGRWMRAKVFDGGSPGRGGGAAPPAAVGP